MECKKESKNFRTELVEAREIYDYKPYQLEEILGALEAIIQTNNDRIAEENFITAYETIQDGNIDIDLSQFQSTYEKVCKKLNKLPTHRKK